MPFEKGTVAMGTSTGTNPRTDEPAVVDDAVQVPPRRRHRAAIVVVGLVVVSIVASVPFVASGTVGSVVDAIRRQVTNGPIDDNRSLAPIDTGGGVGRDLVTAEDRARAFQGRAATLRNTTDSPIVLVRAAPMHVRNLEAVVVQVNRPARPDLSGCFLEGPEFDARASCRSAMMFDPKPVAGSVVPARSEGPTSTVRSAGVPTGGRADEVDIFARLRLADARGPGGIRGLVVDYRIGRHGALRRATFSDLSLGLCPRDDDDRSYSRCDY